MTIRHQLETESITLIIIAALLGGFFVWRNSQNAQNQFHINTPLIAENNVQTVVSPTINPVLQVDTSSQTSPDGTKTLMMKATHNTNNTITYDITAVNNNDNSQQEVYTTILSDTENLSIPFNTWSPDDKYIFLQKNTTDALVFDASGSSISATQQYFDIGDTFTQRKIPNAVQQTIGWASPTLLIVDTIQQDQTKGPSYWFEVPSTAIIQLASQF